MAELSPFEMYEKEFSLRLKLIETVGKWNKDMAEAEVKWAEARLTHAKASTIERVNQELHIAFQELKREERKAEDKLSKAANDSAKTRLFVTAKKPNTPITFAQAWAAFDWFLGEADSDAVLEVVEMPVTATHRAKRNFIPLLTKGAPLTDAGDDISTFGPLKAWMQANYYFFRAGPVHVLVLKAMNAIRTSRAAVVDNLERRLAAARTQSYDKLTELRVLLGLPVAAQKTPTTPVGAK